MKGTRKKSSSGSLSRLPRGSILAFKIRNRRGFVTIAMGCLTEGRTLAQAYARLAKACRRFGFQVPENSLPTLRKY